MTDPINPEHYKQHSIEAVEVVEEFFRSDSHLATAYVYLHRAGMKPNNTSVQDYKKAIWWLQRAITHHVSTTCIYSRGKVSRIRQEVFFDRPHVGEAFFQMVMATGSHAPYVSAVRGAITWLRTEIEGLEGADTADETRRD